MYATRLLSGIDPRSPTRTLDLASGPLANGASGIFLQIDGFAPGPGKLDVNWSGRSPRRDGQRRNDSSRDNAEATLQYSLLSPSMAGTGALQRKISAFFRDCQLFEEEAQLEPAWLEYGWTEYSAEIAGLPTPTVGGLRHYLRVRRGEVETWLRKFHAVEATSGYVLDVEMQLTCDAAAYGLPEPAWSAVGAITMTNEGIRLASGTTPTFLRRALTTELSGVFSLSVWVTVDWTPPGIITRTILDYYVDASNELQIFFDTGSPDVWILSLEIGGEPVAITTEAAIAEGDHVHFVVTYDDPDLTLYINGALVDTETLAGTLPDNGTVGLGSPADSAADGEDVILDGFRIWSGTALTAAEVAALYAAELPVKAQADNDTENFSTVGTVPYWLTTAGDGVVENPGYGVLGGVSGDVDALVEWLITPVSLGAISFNGLWIGRKAVAEALDPTDMFILPSGFNSFAGAGAVDLTNNITPAAFVNPLRGAVQLLASISSAGDPATMTPLYYYSLVSPYRIDGTDFTVADSATERIYDGGDLFVNWPFTDTPGQIFVGWIATVAGATDVTIDFTVALPHPMLHVHAQANPFQFDEDVVSIRIDNDDAAGVDGTFLEQPLEKRGDVTLEPNKYNYIILVFGAHGDVTDMTTDWTVQPTVTPRFALPGGLVA